MTTTTRIHLSLSTLVAAAIALGAAATGAFAAPGDLTFKGCVSPAPSSGCGSAAEVGGREGIAASPVGGSVYAVSTSDDSVAQFEPGPDGTLTEVACFVDSGLSSCTNPSGANTPLDGALGVAVSPNGDSVYVASGTASSIAHFQRVPDGSLTFAGCIADGGANACTNPSPGQAPLNGAKDVVVSPDGVSVYVVSALADSISRFNRLPGGGLVYAGCIANGGANGCANPSPGNAPLDLISGVAVSPGPVGTSVYAVSESAGSISHFSRAGDGALTFSGCIADGGANGCTDPSPGNVPLSQPVAVAVTPGGDAVYSAGTTSVVRFTRSASGSLGFSGCTADGGAAGCADPSPGNSVLSNAKAVDVAPDGAVYVAAAGASDVVHLRWNGGALSSATCLASVAGNGCAGALASGHVLEAAGGVAASYDGTRVFTTAGSYGAVSTLGREAVPSPEPAPSATVTSPLPVSSPPPRKKCKRKKSKKSAASAKKKCKTRRKR